MDSPTTNTKEDLHAVARTEMNVFRVKSYKSVSGRTFWSYIASITHIAMKHAIANANAMPSNSQVSSQIDLRGGLLI